MPYISVIKNNILFLVMTNICILHFTCTTPEVICYELSCVVLCVCMYASVCKRMCVCVCVCACLMETFSLMSDICLQSRKVSGYTTFTIRTRRINTLPIIDFMPKDYGEDSQQFGFEAGPVCFV